MTLTRVFPERLAVGVAHEQRVADELTARGWAVDRWGQGLLSPRVRAALSGTESLLRFEPDLIASRGEDSLVMLDCKASMSPNTRRRLISRTSFEAAMRLMGERLMPFYFVFDDLTVVAPHELMRPGWPSPARSSYYRVPDALCMPFDALFGRRRWQTQASAA